MDLLMNLDEATVQYWEVKRAYHGRNKGMTTERALNLLKEVLTVIGPHHPLAGKVNELQTAIIHGD